MNRIYIVLFLFAFTRCTVPQDPSIEVIELQISKTTIPEGIAVDPGTKEIYLSSLHEDKVTKSSSDGTESEVVLDREDNGYSIGVGMEIHDNKLYALGRLHRSHRALLSMVDLQTLEVSSFTSLSKDSTYFNDLAIDQMGNCYMTDTNDHSIYYFDALTREITTFLKHDRITYPNGIAISSDGSKLFIDSYLTGIKIVNISTKEILNEDHQPTTRVGIDGLKYHKGNLYYIVNGGNDKSKHGLFKIKLNDHETDLSDPMPLLVNHELMNIPTTLAIVDDEIYVLANSQLEGLDQENNEITDVEGLTSTFVLKYKL